MSREKSGEFLGMPYDFRSPTRQRFRERVWNPDDRRVLTPKVYGWGYSVNMFELGRRLRLVRRK